MNTTSSGGISLRCWNEPFDNTSFHALGLVPIGIVPIIFIWHSHLVGAEMSLTKNREVFLPYGVMCSKVLNVVDCVCNINLNTCIKRYINIICIVS